MVPKVQATYNITYGSLSLHRTVSSFMRGINLWQTSELKLVSLQFLPYLGIKSQSQKRFKFYRFSQMYVCLLLCPKSDLWEFQREIYFYVLSLFSPNFVLLKFQREEKKVLYHKKTLFSSLIYIYLFIHD